MTTSIAWRKKEILRSIGCQLILLKNEKKKKTQTRPRNVKTYTDCNLTIPFS